MTPRPTCRDCQQPILRGLDGDTAGIPVTLDPQPVDNFGEALALISGRRTFNVSTVNESGNYRRVMDERTASSIRGGSRVRAVHPEHRCHQPLPAAQVDLSRGWATGTEF